MRCHVLCSTGAMEWAQTTMPEARGGGGVEGHGDARMHCATAHKHRAADCISPSSNHRPRPSSRGSVALTGLQTSSTRSQVVHAHT